MKKSAPESEQDNVWKLDYNKDWERLESEPNPFAVVVMAQLKVLEALNKNDLLAWKLRLVRMLYQRDYSRQDVLELFRFIDWLVKLPEELEQQFWLEVNKDEEARRMPYITSVERIGMQRGLEMGLEKGREEGKLLLLLQQLNYRLGKLEPEVEARVRKLTPKRLDKLSLAWLDFAGLDDLTAWLDKNQTVRKETKG